MDTKIYDAIIIGAGTSGMSMANLLKKDGWNVLVLESHFYPGGCASYFKRGPYSFDVGATTISSFSENRPLKKFFDQTGLELQTEKIDPGIVFHINDKKILRHSDLNKWILEFDQKLNIESTNNFWIKANDVYEKSWNMVYDYPNFPSFKANYILDYLSLTKLRNFKLLPKLFSNLESSLPHQILNNPEAKKVLEELLFITAQNNLKNTPELLGLFGLFYPEDTHYVIGGMQELTKCLAKNIPINLMEKVISAEKENDLFKVTTLKSSYRTKNLISAIPIQNIKSVLKNSEKIVNIKTDYENDCWSAFALYFVIPKIELDGLYHQIHLQDSQLKSFFVSFSKPNDPLRKHSEELTVTISTHVKANRFFDIPASEYDQVKEQYKMIILNKFLDVFKLKLDQIKHLHAATPITYQRYTGRHLGQVGGIPHDLKRIPFGLNSSHTKDDHFFLLGDHIFPGQGIAGTILGSINLHSHLTK